MNYKILSFALLFGLPFMASGTSLIVCEPQDKNGNTDSGIWPVPYLLNNKLCFDMRIDSGNTCAGNGRTANWFSRGMIVTVDNESKGRDDTFFRVIKPVINDKEIEYNKWLDKAIKNNEIPPMTSTQCSFAKQLFEEDNFKILTKWGDLDVIYKSIRKHLKP